MSQICAVVWLPRDNINDEGHGVIPTTVTLHPCHDAYLEKKHKTRTCTLILLDAQFLKRQCGQ